jgi:hypothetical protein
MIFITVTRHTELKSIFSPKVTTIITAVRVVTESASTNNQRPMDVLAGAPRRLGIMAGKTDVLNFTRGKPDPPWFNRLLVTGETELAAHRAVLPNRF